MRGVSSAVSAMEISCILLCKRQAWSSSLLKRHFFDFDFWQASGQRPVIEAERAADFCQHVDGR